MQFVRNFFIILTLFGSAFSYYSCRKPQVAEIEEEEWFSGGSQTVFVTGSGAFGEAFPSMSEYYERLHDIGDKAFEQTFVSAPAPINQGLGPIFNNVSCVSCHIGDGRGKAPNAGVISGASPFLIRLSVPGQDTHGGPLPAPNYGGQLQTAAIFASQAEATVNLSYSYITDYFSDGESYELRVPTITLSNMYAGSVAGLMISPRLAPPVFGLGLLEAIPEANLLANADEMDSDGDGISGRANYVWSVENQATTIGRFGWKANVPSVIEQVAGAYHGDMGVTTYLFPTESSYGQSQYIHYYDESDLSDSLLTMTSFYIKTLAVPARRDVNETEVMRGKEVFADAKCVVCHVPKQRTGVDVSFPAVSNQLIFPYTDMLLHDMGSGLADNRPDFLATGQEWRTTPLWGIGLTQNVNGHTNFLHDGRARNLMEAIMWHGGEAESAKQYVKNLPKSDRDALIQFLKSL